MSASTASASRHTLQDAWRKPGKAFRARLLKQDEEEGGSHFVLSPTCSIRKYFDVADRVLEQFLQHPIDSKEDLVEAYLVGNRLCRFLSNVLPTHPDYWSTEEVLVANRSKSHSQLVELVYFCKQLAIMIDEEEHQSYISRVLDSSVDKSTRHTDTGESFEAPILTKFQESKTEQIVHEPVVDVLGSNNTSANYSTASDEARDPSIELHEDDTTTTGKEDNFDDMWAKVATTTNISDIRTRPMKDPNHHQGSRASPAVPEDANEWQTFSEDMSWTKMSLSVSSSKFRDVSMDNSGEGGLGETMPPQVVKSKRKKKKSKQLAPIDDTDEFATAADQHGEEPGTNEWEKRLRRAQRNMENIDAGSSESESYPMPPESDYVSPRRPPRETPLDVSPNNVLESWAGWEESENSFVIDSPGEISMDDTKASLITEGEKSAATLSTSMNRSSRRMTRRQRAIKGFKCVKCLVEV